MWGQFDFLVSARVRVLRGHISISVCIVSTALSFQPQGSCEQLAGVPAQKWRNELARLEQHDGAPRQPSGKVHQQMNTISHAVGQPVGMRQLAGPPMKGWPQTSSATHTSGSAGARVSSNGQGQTPGGWSEVPTSLQPNTVQDVWHLPENTQTRQRRRFVHE